MFFIALNSLFLSSFLDPFSTPTATSTSIILFVVFCVLFLFFVPSLILNRNPSVLLSPHYIPFFGHFLWLNNNMPSLVLRYHEIYHTMRTKYSSSSFTQMIPFLPPHIHISSPLDLHCLFKSHFDHFEKGQLLNEKFIELLSDGIFNSDGPTWRRQRKVASHMFSQRVLSGKMLKVFVKHSLSLVKILHKHAESGETIDLQSLFNRFTMDSACEIVFGVNLHCLEMSEAPRFLSCFDDVQSTIAERFLYPTFVWKLKNKLKLGKEGKINENLEYLNEFVYGIIEKREEAIKRREAGESSDENGESDEEKGDGGDLLSLFIEDFYKRKRKERESQSQSDNDTKNDSPEDFTVDKKYLRDIIMNMLIASKDTTYNILSQSICLLFFDNEKYQNDPHPRQGFKESITYFSKITRSKQTEVIQRILTEQNYYVKLHGFNDLKDVGLSSSSDDSNIIYDKIFKSLLYSEAAVLESLRHSPSIPMDTKVCVKNTVFPSGINVRKGDIIIWSNYSINRKKEIWGEEAEHLKPERWIEKVNGEGEGEREDDEQGGSEEKEKDGNPSDNWNSAAAINNIQRINTSYFTNEIFTSLSTPTSAPPSSDFSDDFRIKNISTFHYPTFNSSYRLCLGKPMALLETKIVLNFLLREFEFSIEEKWFPRVTFTISLPFTNGLPVRVIRRKK